MDHITALIEGHKHKPYVKQVQKGSDSYEITRTTSPQNRLGGSFRTTVKYCITWDTANGAGAVFSSPPKKINFPTDMDARKFLFYVKDGVFVEKPFRGEADVMQLTHITGHLVDVKFKQGERGAYFILHLVDQDNFYMLSLFAGSRAGHAFLMLAPNLDLSQEMKISVFTKKGRDYLRVKQGDTPVQWYTSFPGYGAQLPKDNIERQQVTVAHAKGVVLPEIHSQPNPYPRHDIYKPSAKRTDSWGASSYNGGQLFRTLGVTANQSYGRDCGESARVACA